MIPDKLVIPLVTYIFLSIFFLIGLFVNPFKLNYVTKEYKIFSILIWILIGILYLGYNYKISDKSK